MSVPYKQIKKRLSHHKRYRMELREFLLENPGHKQAEALLIGEEDIVMRLKSALKVARQNIL